MYNTIDLDGNAVPDNEHTDMATVNTPNGCGQVGVSIERASNAVSIIRLESIDPSETSFSEDMPEIMPLGVIYFEIQLENPGQTIEVDIFFSEAAEVDVVWYKHDGLNGWQDNSARAVFHPDRMGVRLKLKDGGFEDADGVVNGIIVDESGYGVPQSNSSSYLANSSNPGGGVCFIGTVGVALSTGWPGRMLTRFIP